MAALLAACARTPVYRSSRGADVPAASPAQTAPPVQTAPSSETAPPAPTAAAEPPSLQASPLETFDAVVGAIWQWVGLLTPAEELDVYATDRYTIRFLPSGRVELMADCNLGTGSWSVSDDRAIAIGPIALTRTACPPGSLSERFATSVERVSGWFAGDEGNALYLELPDDSGALRFRRSAAGKPLRESR